MHERPSGEIIFVIPWTHISNCLRMSSNQIWLLLDNIHCHFCQIWIRHLILLLIDSFPVCILKKWMLFDLLCSLGSSNALFWVFCKQMLQQICTFFTQVVLYFNLLHIYMIFDNILKQFFFVISIEWRQTSYHFKQNHSQKVPINCFAVTFLF